MKLLVCAALALITAVSSASTPLSASAQRVATTAPAFSGLAAKQQVDALAVQIGSRPAGSPAYDQAVQYAADQLRQWGYQPTLQSFPVQTYEDRGSHVDVPSGPGQSLDVTSAPGQPLDVTPGPALHLEADTLTYSIAGQVEAPLVAAGLGQPADLAAVDLRGKIALIQRGTVRFSEKVAAAADAGAVGVVVYNDSPGRVQGALGKPEPVPAATVSGDSGHQLLDLLAAGPVTVRLVVDASTEQRTGTNVIAELPAASSPPPLAVAQSPGNGTATAAVTGIGASPGAAGPGAAGPGAAGPTGDPGTNGIAGPAGAVGPLPRTVVVGAHLDSVPAGPGANDNGSGSAVVLELAHELAQRPPSERPLTIRFVLFGAEELGLYGSRYYVRSLSDAERAAIVGNINLDMVGVGQSWRFGGTEDLVQRALGAAEDIGQRALPLRGPTSGASDHASFLEAGIPAVFLYRIEDPNYHTANDRADLVDPDALTQAGDIALNILDSLSRQN